MLYSLDLFIIITMNKNNGCHSSLLRIFSRMLSLFPFVFVFLLFIYFFSFVKEDYTIKNP